MELLEAKSRAELEAAYSVLRELRTELSFEEFLSTFKAAERESYKILSVVEDGSVVAVMGYRIIHDFVHGRHVYIDDLAVTSARQSQGLGAKLLAHAEKIARSEKCKGLRLCTGKANTRGIQFYEREGWNPRALAFKKQLDQ